MRNVRLFILLAICIGISSPSRIFGDPPKPGTALQGDEGSNKNQPKPEDVLRRMADYYGKLPAFSCRVSSVLDMSVKGQNNRMETKMTVRLERPNRLAFIVDEGIMGMTVVSDGKQLTQYLPIMKRYVVKDAPADFSGVTDVGAPVSITMLGMSADVIPTSGEELYKKLIEGVTKSEYVGKEKVGDVPCHRLRFTQAEFDWDIWIEDGERPLVHKAVPDLTKQIAGAGAQLEGAKMDYSVTFSDWNMSPKFTDADFSFTPPADAQQVDSLFEGMQDREEGPHPLIGQPAPPFQTVDLEEHPVDLKSELGKKVILLDFWATWCGPCVMAMPKIDATAKKFVDKEFVFHAVNVQEDAATIKEFLESKKLEVPVVLDASGEITQSYKADGIPQTVLIGKDGKVQVVHVGYSETLGDDLSNEITDLLAGKDLADKALKDAEARQKKRAGKSGSKPEANAEEPAAPSTQEEKPAKE
jgi:peroxiredoxin